MPKEPDDDRTEVRSDDAPRTPSRVARFTPGAMLANRYRIIAPLGRGGMGEVYRADDTRLGQEVALKFLPEHAADPRMHERLAAEVRIGRQIAHPNVCRLYDIVDAEGLSFIAMEFVDGEDLSSLLRRIGRLTGDKAIAIAHDLASGLAAAHDAGVIHRDLKPSNVMIDGRGHAKITDFGLALLHGEARREVAGTPAYMAPEQLNGEPPDPLTDLYALGTVLFEIFTGRRLFEADSLSEIARLHRAPKALPSTIVHDIDPAIEKLILACVDESPQRRLRSAHDVLAQLPTRARSGTTPSRTSSREAPSSSARDAKSIAVLPFEDLGAAQDDDYFSVGLAEEIISDLAKIKSLRVISRGSVMRFKGASDLPSVARELQVGYILTGSVRKAGDQLRVTTNLVDGKSDSIIWSEKFRGTLDDIFDIQESVARTVAEQLKGALTAEESEKLSERPIANVIAYEYYLKARMEILKFSDEGLKSALALLEKGLEVVGENALIYAAMAYAYWQYFNAGISADEANLRRAEELAQKIAALEKDSFHVQRIRGLVAAARGDVKTAIIELRKAWAADPNDTDSLFWSSILSSMAGESALGRASAKTLAAVDPFGPYALMAEFFVVWLSGDFRRMGDLAEKLAKIEPENAAYPAIAAYATLLRGDREENARLMRIQSDLFPDHFFTRTNLFITDAAYGRRDDALVALEAIAEPAWNDLQYSLMVGEGFALLDDRQRAFEWLENAVGRGFLAVDYLRLDPLLETIRSDGRYATLIERVRRESETLHRELETAGVL